MKPVLIDTSALFAYLVATDSHHEQAKRIGQELFRAKRPLISHSFIVCEIVALLHHRVGPEAVRQWEEVIRPLMDIVWVDEPLYQAAIRGLLAQPGQGASLVDMVSFELMRQRRLSEAFAFDDDFSHAGFTTL